MPPGFPDALRRTAKRFLKEYDSQLRPFEKEYEVAQTRLGLSVTQPDITHPRAANNFAIICVGASAAPMDRSRELVEHNDQRQTRSRAASPRVQLAALGPLEEWRKFLDYVGVRASSKSPLDPTQEAGGLFPRTTLREPKSENVIGRMHR
jgi:hypothetical protein